MSGLFRKEVMDKQSQRHLGDVFLSTPLSFWAITGLITLIMAGLIVVAIFGEYARKERVVGVLVPSKCLVQIIPQQSGVFETVFVQSGDNIERGAPLLKIKDDTALSDGNSISEALLLEMDTEKANLVSQLRAVPSQYKLTKARFETQKVELVAEAERALMQTQIQARSVELEKGILERLQKLFKDEAASTLEVTSQESRYLSAQQSLNALKNNRLKLLASIKDINAQIALLPHQQQKEESEIRNRISVLEQNMIRTDSKGSFVIRSPIKGRITTVTARVGQAASAKPVLAILPEGGELQVELFVPTRAAGFVRKGQSVRLLYDAFPYQKFGFFEGQITRVSKSVVNTANVTNAPQIAEPVFLVTVVVDKQFINARGEQFPLQAGMTLSADLILEDRKIWEWAFEPLLGATK